MPLVTLASFVFFMGAVAVGTWLLTRRNAAATSEGYFLAGRSLTGGYIAGSLLLTNLSTEQMVGLNADAFTDGLSVMAWEVIPAAVLVVMALVFLPRFLKSGVATVPEFLADRFAPSTRTITTTIFIVAYSAITLPVILYTGAQGMSQILDVAGMTGITAANSPFGLKPDVVILWGSVWLIGIIGSCYAILGGLRAVAVSDTLCGFLLLAGGILITVLGLRQIDPDIFAAVRELREAHPEKFNSLGGPEQKVPFTTLFTGVLLINLFYWCTNQQIIQRAFAAKDLAEGQRGVLLAGFFKMLGPLILVVPGIIAFHLYAGKIGDRPVNAYGTLVQAVLPTWLGGFFAAVVAGAILSSFNAVLNSSATLFSLGIYRDVLRPRAGEREIVRSGKVFGVLIAIMSMCAAPFLAGRDSIFGYLQTMNGLYFIPIFAVVVAGMFTRRVPAAAANAALVGGVLLIAAKYFLPWDRFAPAVGARLEAIHNFHFLAIAFAVLLGGMLLWRVVAPRATPWAQRDAGQVDLTPWRWAVPMSVGLVACVLAIYVAFADTSVLKKGKGAADAVAGAGDRSPAEKP